MIKNQVRQEYLPLIMTSFREGLEKPVKLTTLNTRKWFEKTLKEELESHLNAKEYDILAYAFLQREKGLQAAREHKLNEAQVLLNQARQTFVSTFISKEATLVAESFQASAEAYLYYRLGLFDRAKSGMFNALFINSRLQEEFGYTFFQLNSLEVARNIVRLLAKNTNLDESVGLGITLLNYIEDKSEKVPLPGAWWRLGETMLPIEAIRTMYNQVVIELVQILTAPDIKVDLSGHHIFNLTCSINEIFDTPFLQAHKWLQAKQALFSGNDERFITEVTSGLSLGRRDPLLLWYAFVMELLWFVKLEGASEIETTLLKTLKAWSQVPKTWLEARTFL